LLDELQNDYEVVFVERELPAPIDMIVDERNGISILHRDVFEGIVSSLRHLARLELCATHRCLCERRQSADEVADTSTRAAADPVRASMGDSSR